MNALFTLALAAIAAFASAQNPCASSCSFRLCKANGFDELAPNGARILLRDTRQVISPFICKANKMVGRVMTGEAMVRPAMGGGNMVPISKYSPNGLSAKFSKKYFGLFKIPFLPGKQGVGRRKSKGNQEQFVNDLCVNLPVRTYDLLNDDGSVKRTISRARKNDCLSFRTVAPKVLVELSWDSSDDLDLVVTEPDGDVVDRKNPNSESGKLNNDNNVSGCNVLPAGKEQVRYLMGEGAQMGKYSVKIRHFNNCGDGPTKWALRVYIDGKTVLKRKGRSNLAKGSTIGTETFTL